MKNLITENKWFLYPFFLYLVIGGIILINIEKGQDIWFINSFHHELLDEVAKYLTHVGDGLFAAIVILLLLRVSFDYFFWAALAFGISSALTQFLKRVVFSDMARPLKYMGENIGLHKVEGVHIHHDFSFPSGHSTTCFMLFFVLSLVAKDKRNGLGWFLLALLVSLTIPYLLQHFFVDTYIGAVIGATVTAVIWQIKPILWFRKQKV
jgi:membrane-associated phospholipid phosphatase